MIDSASVFCSFHRRFPEFLFISTWGPPSWCWVRPPVLLGVRLTCYFRLDGFDGRPWDDPPSIGIMCRESYYQRITAAATDLHGPTFFPISKNGGGKKERPFFLIFMMSRLWISDQPRSLYQWLSSRHMVLSHFDWKDFFLSWKMCTSCEGEKNKISSSFPRGWDNWLAKRFWFSCEGGGFVMIKHPVETIFCRNNKFSDR